MLRIQAAAIAFTASLHPGMAAPLDYPINPPALGDVKVNGGFWGHWHDSHYKHGIEHYLEYCEKTGRIQNFEAAAGLKDAKHQGASFNDSDVYKIIEGMSWSLAGPLDPKHRKFLDGFIDTLKKAQMDDGYLYTMYQLNKELDKRWTDVENMHEDYCAGHLFEAGAAHFRMTGKRDLLDVCLKFADHIDRIFGPGKKGDPPGHPEIEMALADLYRITGEQRYLNLSRFLLEQRGVVPGYWYHQHHVKLLDGTEAVGHAVRAVYAYCGMAEIAALTGDERYIKALDRYWESVTNTKMALSGGIGGGLWEAFDQPYFLPNRTSYNETCGSIAQVFWNHRMFRLTGDAKYLDVMERALYNGVLTGVQHDCKAFFYPNQLENSSARRQPWFDCACCPSNIARMIPSQPRYAYASNADTLFTCLYTAGEATLNLGGNKVKVEQQTEYPWNGKVDLKIVTEIEKPFTVALRIPGWSRNKPVPGDLYRYIGQPDAEPSLQLNGKAVPLEIQQGFARIRRVWKSGDTITLDLPMSVRGVIAHERVLDNTGRIALERGPLVYCVEGIDNDQLDAPHNLLISNPSEFKANFRPELLNGVTVLNGPAELIKRDADGISVTRMSRQITAVPYYARANREVTPMSVFLLADQSAAILPPVPSLATSAKVTSSSGKGDFKALSNQIVPARSADTSRGAFTWDERFGTTEWVQYEFPEAKTVRESSVYWHEHYGKAYRLPKAWRLLYRDSAGDWKPVETKDAFGLAPNAFNTVRFSPVKTNALRIEADLQDALADTYFPVPSSKPGKYSAGILEWSVQP